MVCRIFGGEHCAHGESLAGVCVVGYRDAVSIAVVYHGVYARHFAAAYALDGKLIGSHLVGALHGAVGITLHAFNPYYPDIHYTPEEVETLPVRFFGRVVETRSKY